MQLLTSIDENRDYITRSFLASQWSIPKVEFWRWAAHGVGKDSVGRLITKKLVGDAIRHCYIGVIL